jgi:predicted Zn-dependent protease
MGEVKVSVSIFHAVRSTDRAGAVDGAIGASCVRPNRALLPQDRGCRAAALLSIILFLLFGSGCATSRVTGELTYNFYDEEEDIELGTQVISSAIQSFRKAKVPVDADKKAVRMLRKMLYRIAHVTHYPEFPWEVHLAEINVPNAWCAPGGKVMVYRGLFHPTKGLVKTKNELAAVLGHEMAHAACRHVMRSQSQQKTLRVTGFIFTLAIMGLFSPGGAAIFDTMFAGGVNLFCPAYSRSQEREADRVGLLYMARAGFDPQAAVRLWDRAAKIHGDSYSIFASHPPSGERAENLREVLPQALEQYRKVKAGQPPDPWPNYVD